MKLKNSRWTMVMVGVIAFLVVGTMVWASPPAGAPSAPLQAYDANNADRVDGLHASRRPMAGTLLALNKNKKFRASVIPAAITRDKEVMPIVKANINDLLPAGVIVMWSGTLDSVPEGWALCNGTNGTPDLRDRFVYGVSQGEDPGTTGGSELHNHAYIDLPIHTHAASSVEAGEHSHTYGNDSDQLEQREEADQTGLWRPVAWQTYNTSEAGSHSHDITIDSEGVASPVTDVASSLPPFYKLAFIIKL